MFKDQSGVSASEAFLETRGEGTYGGTISGSRVWNLKYRPIRHSYFILVLATNECLRCRSPLIRGGNARTGGVFHKCQANGHQCYNIGIDKRTGKGYELRVTPLTKETP